MKPVAIFRHTEIEGPGYFATFLEHRSIPWKLIALDRGEAIPARAEDFSGIGLMGGPMSVNDPLPWVDESCALICDAVAHDVPVIGHCLGGQLISKALGGQITRNPVKEIGWGAAQSSDSATARRWLGDAGDVTVFQWHGETFSLPAGAESLLSSDFCANQMFALGKHLAMQCHVEMTSAMISAWCASWPDEVTGIASLPASIQTPQQMLADAPTHLPAMRKLADHLYSRWVEGLSSA